MSAISQGWAAIWNGELKLTLSFLKLLMVGTFYHSHRKETGTAISQLPLSHASHFTDPMTSCPFFLLRMPTSCKPVFGLGFLCIIQSPAKSSCPATTKDSSETKYKMVSGVVLHNTYPPLHHQNPVLGAVVFLWWKTSPTICFFWSKQLCVNSLVQIVTVSFMMVADPQAAKELARFLITRLYVSRLIYAEVIFPRSAS